MVGEEAKTKIPIYQNYIDRGFDPQKHVLQSYGTGWQSAQFLSQERQLFGAPGGFMHNWDLETNIRNIFVAGDATYASDCAGYACTTGRWAGAHAAEASRSASQLPVDRDKIHDTIAKAYAPLDVNNGYDWRELNLAVSKAMQNYCGGLKCDETLIQGLDLIHQLRDTGLKELSASNPHELVRIHEISDIIDVCELILESSLARKASAPSLFFERTDSNDSLSQDENCYIVIRNENGDVKTRRIPHGFYGDLSFNYEKHNMGGIRK